MKKILSHASFKLITKQILISLVLISINLAVYSQSCLPEGIYFSEQAQIDSFPIYYPNCSSIEGSVLINGDDITNLEGLTQVSNIGSDLIIGGNPLLSDITGLRNITSIGRSLKIGYYVEIGPSLNLHMNPSLSSLSGLEGLDHINGELLVIGNLPLNNLSGLNNITSIDSNLYIWYNPSLNEISSLVNLDSIGGHLSITSNHVLPSLLGLENIKAASIKDLAIYNNFLLSECDISNICEYLKAPNGFVEIYANGPGCDNPDEIQTACEGFSINEQLINSKITIYPNPAQNEVNISLPGHDIDELFISTFSGQEVIHIKPAGGLIDVSKLHSGVYVVEMSIENIRIKRKLMIIK